MEKEMNDLDDRTSKVQNERERIIKDKKKKNSRINNLSPNKTNYNIFIEFKKPRK